MKHGKKHGQRSFSRGFWQTGCTEIFECISYYMGKSLILIFTTASVAQGGLGLTAAQGAALQSLFIAFAFFGPLVGGAITDRWLGARYATPIGMVLVGIGYWCGSMARSVTLVYVMIFFVCAGRSLFQVSAMLGRIAADKDRMDAAYSIRYTLMNVGGFLGTFSLGILYKDVFAVNGVFGFSACFRVAACAMFLGTIWFISGWREIGEVGKRPFKTEKTAEEKNWEKEKLPVTVIEKKRIGAIFLVSGFSVIFWMLWDLAYLPAYYYWTKYMDWTIAGYEIPVSWFDSSNSLFCVILGPVMAGVWLRLSRRPKGDMSLFRKTGIALFLLGLAYLYYAVLDIVRGNGKPSAVWLIFFTFTLTLGEMFFAPLGHAFISKYAPSRYLSTMMAVWGLAIFLASLCYGKVYGRLFESGLPFTKVCEGITVMAVAAGLILFMLDKRLSGLVKE